MYTQDSGEASRGDCHLPAVLFREPKDEHAVAAPLKTLGLPLSISHLILPEFREYERTSTVVVNAYLQPVMQRYLENLEVAPESLSNPAQLSRFS